MTQKTYSNIKKDDVQQYNNSDHLVQLIGDTISKNIINAYVADNNILPMPQLLRSDNNILPMPQLLRSENVAGADHKLLVNKSLRDHVNER